MSSELPKGWASARLVEIVTKKKGKKPAILRDTPAEGYVPYLDIRAIEKNVVREFAEVKSSKIASKDDLFVVWDGARSGWVGGGITGAIGSTIMALTVQTVESAYVRRFIAGQFQNLNTNTRGTGIPHVDPEIFWNLEVPLAPLAEQRRIVAKLEKLLGQVDACQQRLEKLPTLLKRFRQSVLAAACSGRLTADWREENEAEEWNDVTLADVIIGKPKNGYSAKPVQRETRWRVLTLTATTSGRFDGRHFKYFDEPIAKDSPFWLQTNDILVQRGNTIEYVGVPAIYDGLPNQFIYPDLMMRVRANEKITTKFLYFALSWERTRQFLRDGATGTAGNMPKINQPMLMSAPISLPPLAEQQEIVRRVAGLFALADQLELRLAQARKQVDKLTPSLLARAFAGQLVPQNPADEPADKLLERIYSKQTKPQNHQTKDRK